MLNLKRRVFGLFPFLKIHEENIGKYILLAPNMRLESLTYACLLLHVNTQNPLKQFFIDPLGRPFLLYNVLLRITIFIN